MEVGEAMGGRAVALLEVVEGCLLALGAGVLALGG